MMPQMESDGVQRERPGYGRYEGQQQGYPPAQDPYSPSQHTYDDDFVDTLAQRIAQRMTQGARDKVQPTAGSTATPGMRLALAIVSVVMLIPITAIVMGIAFSFGTWFVSLPILFVIVAAITVINIVFNRH